MSHRKIHSFTGSTDHDFTGLISGQLLNIDASGTTIASSGVYALSGTVTAATYYSGSTPLQTILNAISGVSTREMVAR